MHYYKHLIRSLAAILLLQLSTCLYGQISVFPYSNDFEQQANGWAQGPGSSLWTLGNPSSKQFIN
jgi:hypothetical protein